MPKIAFKGKTVHLPYTEQGYKAANILKRAQESTRRKKQDKK